MTDSMLLLRDDTLSSLLTVVIVLLVPLTLLILGIAGVAGKDTRHKVRNLTFIIVSSLAITAGIIFYILNPVAIQVKVSLDEDPAVLSDIWDVYDAEHKGSHWECILKPSSGHYTECFEIYSQLLERVGEVDNSEQFDLMATYDGSSSRIPLLAYGIAIPVSIAGYCIAKRKVLGSKRFKILLSACAVVLGLGVIYFIRFPVDICLFGETDNLDNLSRAWNIEVYEEVDDGRYYCRVTPKQGYYAQCYDFYQQVREQLSRG